MDVDVFPLAEVDLKVEDVAINFDDEEREGYGDGEDDSGTYNDCQMRNALNLMKQEPGYEAFNVHFLSATNVKPELTDTTKRFQCEDCGRYFGRNDHLKNHRRTHTGERPYGCDMCPRTFAKQFDLTRHKQYVHGTVMQFFICEECGRTFSRKDHLKSHLLTHKNQPSSIANNEVPDLLKAFTCETCGRTYNRLDNLKKHMKKHFGKIDGANFASKADEEMNVRFINGTETFQRSDPGAKHHACEFCGRLFSRKDHLKNHERTHTGERPFECDQCDRRFAKRYVLTRHIQNVHRVNLKLYDCTECERKFTRNDHLKIHMKIHILKAMRNQEREKEHKCDACGKAFAKRESLKTHVRSHSQEGRQLCGLGFPPLGSILEHEDLQETARS